MTRSSWRCTRAVAARNAAAARCWTASPSTRSHDCAAMISIIVAMAENGVIGSDNRLPWHLPDDLKRFKLLSLGKPIVMGRRTFESIGRPLPGRTNIVVSRQAGLAIDGAVVARLLDAALAAAGTVPEVVVSGGAEIFR